MSASAASYDFVQGCGYAVLSKSHLTLAELHGRGDHRFAFAATIEDIASDLAKVIGCFHDSPFLELLDEAQRSELAGILRKVHDSMRSLIAAAQLIGAASMIGVDAEPKRTLEKSIEELAWHIKALEMPECQVLALSRKDQETVQQLLDKPPEPSRKLSDLFGKHTRR
jgi:hypothetical protein